MAAVMAQDKESDENLAVEQPDRNEEKEAFGLGFKEEAKHQQRRNPNESHPAPERGDGETILGNGLTDFGQSFHSAILNQ